MSMKIPRLKPGFSWVMLPFLVLAGTPFSAWSQCTSFTSDRTPYFIAHLSNMIVPPFNPGDYAIGSTIYSHTGHPVIINKTKDGAQFYCLTGGRSYLKGIGNHSNNIYPTSVPNIGIRLTAHKSGVLPTLGTTGLPFFGASIELPRWIETDEFQTTIDLIKTGNITAEGTLTGSFAQYRFDSETGQLLVEFRFATPVFIKPRIPTCKVADASKSISHSLGTVRSFSFTGVGSTGPSSEEFYITLQCANGDAGTSTNAHVTLTDVNSTGNRSTYLTLSKTSTASGVGIQVLYKDVPLNFGPESAAVGNTNQWFAGNIAQGQREFRIPLRARFVQTAAEIKRGDARAAAVFTLSYQ